MELYLVHECYGSSKCGCFMLDYPPLVCAVFVVIKFQQVFVKQHDFYNSA